MEMSFRDSALSFIFPSNELPNRAGAAPQKDVFFREVLQLKVDIFQHLLSQNPGDLV